MVQLSPQDKDEDGSKQPGIRGREERREKEQALRMACLEVLSGWRVGRLCAGRSERWVGRATG